MSANPPADERDRKRAREVLDTSFAVEAAAGAGKTSVLVSRVLNLVRRTDTRLDRIVAVTFTEKAAGELRVRIREEIEKEISDFGFRIADCAGGGSEIRNPKSEIRNLGRAIEDLGHAPIGTIHGFCARLLRERPVEAGVDPQFAVADELTASLLRDRTWAKWLDAELAAGNPALLRAAARGVRFDGMGNHILGLAEKLMDCRDLLGGLPRAASREPRAASRLGTELLTALDSLIWETQGNAAGGLAEEFLAKLEAARRQLALAGAMSEASGEAAIADLYVPGRFLGQKHWKAKDQHKRAEAIYQKLVADLDAAKQALGQDLAAAIGAALAGFLDAYRAAKDAEGLLDFEDLLLLTRNMLRDSRPARDHFKARFDYILIDEFQDTDPLQVEIAFFLAERADRHAADWQQVELEPGKLFIVGDPKQSIYRFRRADIEVYERAKDAICRQGEPLVLSQSFRPVPGVASAVNAVFSPHFKKPDDGFYQPDYVALDPYRAAVGGRPAAILLYPPPDVAEQLEKADSARTLEARCVAAMIRRIVEEKWLIEDPDKDAQPRTRPVEYRDIAILARTFTSTEHYAEAFSAADVPLRIVGGRHFYVAHEVHALLNVLKAIVNPHDGVALVAALRGPFFGISDDELLLAKCQQGTLTYLGTTIENQESKIANALAVLREFHERRNDAGLALLLQGLFERTKALELFALRPGGEQRVANLLKVLEQARALEATQRVTFRGLVRWLARLQETEVRESESPSSEAGDDFVQFLSIHGAKGLEFPVVFVADISAPEGRATKFIVLRDRPEADGQLAFYVGKKDDAIRTANWPGDEHEKRRADAEAARLFYVATTRARDLLFLLPGWGKKGEGLMRFLGEAANRRGGVEDEDEDEGRGRLGTQTPCGTAYDTATLDLSESSARAFRIRLPDAPALPAAAKARLAERQRWRQDTSEGIAEANRGTEVKLPSKLGAGLEVPKEAPEATVASDAGRRIGSAVHHCLKRAMLDEPQALHALLASKARELALSPADARRAAELLDAALGSAILRRARAALASYSEVPFSLKVGDVLLTGAMDLLFAESDGVVVVDYKTDATDVARPAGAEEIRVGDAGHKAALARLVATYRPQMLAYALAAQRTLCKPVKEVVLFFLSSGWEWPIPITEAALREAESVVTSSV